MRGTIIAGLVGCLLGGGAVALFGPGREADETAPRADRERANTDLTRRVEDQAQRIEELQTELGEAKLELARERDRVAELEAAGAQSEIVVKEVPDPATPLTDAEFEAGLKVFSGRLQAIVLGNDDGEAAKDLRALLKRAGPEGMAKIRKRFEDPASGFEGRLIAAHVLGQSGDPQAIALLKETVLDADADLLEHRVASHALAFSDAEDLVPTLTQVARSDPDPGARANAAFGLVHRDIDEGYQLYAEATDLAFERGQPEAMQFLQGYFIMGEKALPHIRARLGSYENETALLVLIEIVKRKQDKGALEQLKKLAYDSGKPKSVQNAAQGALKALGAE